MHSTSSSKVRILLIGDSISVQYGPYLQAALGPNIEWVERDDSAIAGALTNLDKPQDANSGDSKRASGRITNLLKVHKVDLLLVNCGLHDIKTDPKTGSKQVSLQEYELNLQKIVDAANTHNVPMIWMRTALVNSDIHNSRCADFHRYENDVDQYNAAADQVMNAAGIPVIDLWQFTRQLGTDDQLFCDHVHYANWVRQCQGSYLAGYVQSYLDRPANA